MRISSLGFRVQKSSFCLGEGRGYVIQQKKGLRMRLDLRMNGTGESTAGILCLSFRGLPSYGRKTMLTLRPHLLPWPLHERDSRGIHSRLRFPKSQLGQGLIPALVGRSMWTTLAALRTPLEWKVTGCSQKNEGDVGQTMQLVSTSRLPGEFFLRR